VAEENRHEPETRDLQILGQRLLGAWTTEATHPYLPGAVIRGSSEIEWLEGERFLIYRSSYDHPDIPDAISIIGDTAGLRYLRTSWSDPVEAHAELSAELQNRREVLFADTAGFTHHRGVDEKTPDPCQISTQLLADRIVGEVGAAEERVVRGTSDRVEDRADPRAFRRDQIDPFAVQNRGRQIRHHVLLTGAPGLGRV
jgi:hypothetical protein